MPEVNDSFAMNGASPGIFVQGPTGAPTMGDPVQGARVVTVQATAVATQDIAIPLPLGLSGAGARVISITAFQNTAPTGATDTMSFGSTVGGVDIAAAQDVKTSANAAINLAVGGSRPLVVANFASIVASQAGGSVVNLRLTQTTPTAVGNWTVVIEYVMA